MIILITSILYSSIQNVLNYNKIRVVEEKEEEDEDDKDFKNSFKFFWDGFKDKGYHRLTYIIIYIRKILFITIIYYLHDNVNIYRMGDE